MQAIPHIFSTDAAGNDKRNFLADFFPTTAALASNIFLKGYQWPFDPQRIENLQSSLIDILVFNETRTGRRVFMDFLTNPTSDTPFTIQDLAPPAREYLQHAQATQPLPIDRLAHMNSPAIDIYAEHDIDLRSQPLEIALCAQHNNGGFAVNKWWESNIPHTFVIGEMAGTHGVKRPGGSALNAGQVAGLRAAEFITNVYLAQPSSPQPDIEHHIHQQLQPLLAKLTSFRQSTDGPSPLKVIQEIRQQMTASGGHIRELTAARGALTDAVKLCETITATPFSIDTLKDMPTAIQAEHQALASTAYLKAVVALLELNSGSRGSHLVLSDDGIEIHKDIINEASGQPLRFKPENTDLRDSVLQIQYSPTAADLFECKTIPTRKVTIQRKAFEPAWKDFRDGNIFTR